MRKLDRQALELEVLVAEICDPALGDVFLRLLHHEISPEVAVMQMLIATESYARIRSALQDIEQRYQGSILEVSDARELLDDVWRILAENREGCVRIQLMLQSGMDSDQPAASTEEGIAFSRRLFDWSVEQCEEASVALYSLGNPVILDRATSEVMSLFDRWGVLGSDRAVLQIGCGIGRMEQAIAGSVREAVGIDVSPNMIRAARRRCADLENVRLLECSGRDLSIFGAGQFDLVYAVDSFPYLVQSGMSLVERHFAETKRVLKTGGDFAILDFSYRGDPELDRLDVERLARDTGFEVIVNGVTPFELWNGMAFQLRSRE